MARTNAQVRQHIKTAVVYPSEIGKFRAFYPGKLRLMKLSAINAFLKTDVVDM